jgi:glycopeptide antibiotics resistance protein
MLSANVLVIVGGAAMIVVIVMGRARGTSGPTIVARCALIGAVGWIVALTIFPIPVEARWWRFHRQFSNMSFVPFRTIGTQLSHGLERSEAKQLFGNLVLFAPLGFLLPSAVRACRRLWPTLLVAAGLSVLIETTQALLPGHSSDVDDVILNTTGAALGYLAFWVIAWTSRQRTARDEGTLREPAPSSAG